MMMPIRPANAEDAKFLWEWRNDSIVRKQSFSSEPIAWADHEAWFAAQMTSPDTRLFILEVAGIPVAQIRYERRGESRAEVAGFSVKAEARGKAYGKAILAGTLAKACDELRVDSVAAVIKDGNPVSSRVFLSAGFSLQGRTVERGCECSRYVFSRSVVGIDGAASRKVVAIIQARMGSSRLPGKALAEIAERPAIWHLFKQLSGSRYLNTVMLATTTNPSDDPLAAYAAERGWRVFRGSEPDVLDRYYHAALAAGCVGGDAIVRVTGDDILIDPEVVDQVVELYLSHRPRVSHASNNRTPGFPYGADVEVFAFEALERAWRHATLPEEREHVTPYIRNRREQFPYVELKSPADYSRIRLSIDYPEDLEFNRQLVAKLYRTIQSPFHLKDIIRCIEEHDLKHPAVPLEKSHR